MLDLYCDKDKTAHSIDLAERIEVIAKGTTGIISFLTAWKFGASGSALPNISWF